MLSKLRSRHALFPFVFLRLLLCDAISTQAVMVGRIGVSWWIVTQYGVYDLAIYTTAQAAGAVFFLPVLSPIADRCSKGSALVLSLAAMTVAGTALAILVQFETHELALIIACSLVAVASDALLLSASTSLVAELVPSKQLAAGLNAQGAAQILGRLLGPAMGGAVVGVGGASAVLWLHVALLGIACAVAGRLSRMAPHVSGRHRSNWLSEIRAGLTAKWTIKVERMWTIASFAGLTFISPGIGMMLPVKVQSLGLSGLYLGLFEVALATGMLAGAIGISARAAQSLGGFAASGLAVGVIALCFGIIGSADQSAAVISALLVAGLAIATGQCVGNTRRMLATPQAFQARMTGVHMAIMQIAGSVGPVIAAVALGRLGIDGTYLAFGGAILLVGVLGAFAPGYRQLMNMSNEAAQEYYGHTYPKLFL